ncbi:PLAC8 family-domain-containing protein [Bombardia bombarda]|uniref:PLAC8 family-domain-containing protein n=1 Tax=Bombardia bombarda TaxID=252184 RepID=A0AA39W9U5_9PEZI|nr:PLAC8 family-domain-containing protein [Bombardia bombarda]
MAAVQEDKAILQEDKTAVQEDKTVVQDDKTVVQQDKTVVQETPWETGLFNCAPWSSCLLASFLPCYLAGRTADRMRDPSLKDANWHNSECLSFYFVNCLCGCGWMHILDQRGEIRKKYGIEGSEQDDCCTSYWCGSCAALQQDNEVKLRAARNAPIMEGYKKQEDMAAVGQRQQRQQRQQKLQQEVEKAQKGV